jgi:uncharacterized protein (UPF0179 family)
MNNKIVYFFILFFIPSLEASEKQQVVFDKKIEAGIHFSGGVQGNRYKIVDIRDSLINCDAKFNNAKIKLFNVVDINPWFNSETRITGVVLEKGRQAAGGIDVTIFIAKEGAVFFEKSIKKYYEIYKKNNNHQDCVSVYFLNNSDTSDIISLCLSKKQVEKIIKKPSVKTSITYIILAGLGVAGFIAVLVYYFNLREKQMPWLQYR